MSTTARKRREKAAAPAVEETESMYVYLYAISRDARRAIDSISCADDD